MEFLLKENEKLEEEVDNWKRQYWNLEKRIQYTQLMSSDLKYNDEDFLKRIRPLQQEVIKLQKELENKNKIIQEKNNNKTNEIQTNNSKTNEKDKNLSKKRNLKNYFGSYTKFFK